MAGITDMAAPFNGINDSGLIQEAIWGAFLYNAGKGRTNYLIFNISVLTSFIFISNVKLSILETSFSSAINTTMPS